MVGSPLTVWLERVAALGSDVGTGFFHCVLTGQV
jgi:hypothetical protein